MWSPALLSPSYDAAPWKIADDAHFGTCYQKLGSVLLRTPVPTHVAQAARLCGGKRTGDLLGQTSSRPGQAGRLCQVDCAYCKFPITTVHRTDEIYFKAYEPVRI